MGGLIAARMSQQRPNLFRGVVLKAPAMAVDEKVAPPWQRAVAKWLGKHLPRMPLPGTDLAIFTRNQALLEFAEHDPIATAKVPNAMRFVASALEAMEQAMRDAPGATTPLLILHGDKDPLTPLCGSQQYMDRVGAADKRLKVFPGLFHDFLHDEEFASETEKEIVSFLDGHCA